MLDVLAEFLEQPTSLTVIVTAVGGAEGLDACLAGLRGWAAQVVLLAAPEAAGARDGVDLVVPIPAAVPTDGPLVRNEAARYATQDWVLYLGAGEQVTPGLKAQIAAFLAHPPARLAAVRLPYRAASGAAPWWPDAAAATLVRRWFCEWLPDGRLRAEGLVGRLPGDDPAVAILRPGPAPAGVIAADGPSAKPAASPGKRKAAGVLPVAWEGPQFVYSSPGHINRELCLQLAASGQVDLTILPTWPNEFEPVEPRFQEILARVGVGPNGPVAVHVRHDSPSDLLQRPEAKAWVLMQPWDYGGLPARLVAFMQRQVDEIWVPSSWTRDCYVRSGVPAGKVAVVLNGVDAERYRPDGPRLDIPTGKGFKFLFVGWLVARKGIDLVLDAYLSAFTAADDVCLVIRGAPPEPDAGFTARLRLLAETPGTPAIVHLTESLDGDDLAALYRSCDAFVLPYRGESFALPVAEAMASGLPVIATGYGGCLEFCTPDTGVLLPALELPLAPEDTPDLPPSASGYWWAEPSGAALAAAMRRLAADPRAAAKLGKRARRQITKSFTWSQAAARVLARMQALAAAPPARLDAAALAPPLVSIVIASRDEAPRLALCLESLRRHTPEPHELLVVDRGSADGTMALLQDWPDVHVLAAPTDGGEAAGRNRGLAAARGEHLLLLSPGAVVTPGWLARLLAAFGPPALADVVAPRSNAGGPAQRLPNLPYGFGLDGLDEFARERALLHPGAGTRADGPLDGCCLLLKRLVIERVGGPDPRFADGTYAYEDFCLRARLAGFKTWIADDAFVHDWESPDSGASDVELRASLDFNWAKFIAKWQLPPDLPAGLPYAVPRSATGAREPVPLVPVPDPGYDAVSRFLRYHQDRDFPEALLLLPDALEASGRAKRDDQREAVALIVGNVLAGLGLYPEAADAYRLSLGAGALRCRRAQQSPAAQLAWLRFGHLKSLLDNNLAVMAAAQGQPEQAEPLLHEAAAAFNPVPEWNLRALAERADALYLQEYHGCASRLPLARAADSSTLPARRWAVLQQPVLEQPEDVV